MICARIGYNNFVALNISEPILRDHAFRVPTRRNLNLKQRIINFITKLISSQSKFARRSRFTLFYWSSILGGSLSCCIFCTLFRCSIFCRNSLRFSLSRSILCCGGLDFRIFHSTFCHSIFSHSRVLFIFIHWRYISFLLIGWIFIFCRIILLERLILIETLSNLRCDIVNRKIGGYTASSHCGLNFRIGGRQNAATIKLKRRNGSDSIIAFRLVNHIGQLNAVVFCHIASEDIYWVAKFCPNQTINTQIFTFCAGSVIFNNPTWIARFRNHTISLPRIQIFDIGIGDSQLVLMTFKVFIFIVQFVHYITKNRHIGDSRDSFVDNIFREAGLIKICSCVHHINIDINEAKIRSFIFILL